MNSIGLVVELGGILLSIGVVSVALWFTKLFRGGALEMPMRIVAIGFLIFTIAQLTESLSQLQVLNIPALANEIFMTCFAGTAFTSLLIVANRWKKIEKR